MTAIVMKAYVHPVGRPMEELTSEVEYNPEIERLDDTIVTNIATNARDAYRDMLLEEYVLNRFVFSFWESDSEVYDPLNSRTIPINLPGTRVLGGATPVDETVGLFIIREVAYGRSGRFIFKGYLRNNEITFQDGSWVLTSTGAADAATNVAAFWDNLSVVETPIMIGRSQTSIFYPATPEGEKQIPVRQYAAEPHIRPVLNLVVGGVREHQENR